MTADSQKRQYGEAACQLLAHCKAQGHAQVATTHRNGHQNNVGCEAVDPRGTASSFGSGRFPHWEAALVSPVLARASKTRLLR